MIKDNIDEHTSFTDSVVKSTLSQIQPLYKTYQVHSHSKSCRKYKNEKHRFPLERILQIIKVLSMPLDSNLPEDVRNNNLNERHSIFRKSKGIF